ncbi:HAMP domain-containing sensor histidine kinase [Brevibacillus reuszeri]|uniref:HAMP domain-containing sensor histidine kinase n=1 Tax=Brevibacillus reuszeri TaxID=54915 RepID=UPI002896C428|nr:ATP-binding protein [Brevibacillus reuszeri]
MKRIWLRLALVFMLVSASGILISTLLSIKEMQHHFSLYVRDVNQVHQQDLIAMLRDEYAKKLKWDEGTFQKLEAASQLLGLQIMLYDGNLQLLRSFGDTHTHPVSMSTRDDELSQITDHGKVIGALRIHFDNSGTTFLEEHFQIAHTNAMQWTMLALLLIVCLVSVITAKRFTKPIVTMSDAAVEVAKGNLATRVSVPKGKDELASLVESFNNLVKSLENQEELRKRLTSDVAHELRTPLNTLLAQTEGMIDQVWEATPEHLEAIRAEVLRLIRIVSDLDQVMQAEAGVLTISREQVNVSRLIENTAASMSASFLQKQIELSSYVQAGIRVVGDEQRLVQVLTNLLTNSLKHTDHGGKVSVTAEKAGAFVEVKIIDNGSGITAQDLPFVFERFYRGDRSRNRVRGGAGLGLTIVQGIVEAHQGNIHIDSTVGEGTTVTIRFPMVIEGGQE